MSVSSSLAGPQRRELGTMIALLAVAVIAAAAFPVAGAVLAGAFAVAWSLTSRESRALLRDGLYLYHAPPFARAADCLVALVRHGRAFARSHARGELIDCALAFAFFGLIGTAIGVLEAEKHAPHLAGSGVGIATGLAGWHIVLELIHEPERVARYRRQAAPPIRHSWVFATVLLLELAAFLTLEAANDVPNHPFLRGLLTGIAALGLADAATLGSTLVAISTRGRPLR